jgi:hypothetical protein
MASTFYHFGVAKVEVAPVPTAPGTTPTWEHVPSVESAVVKLTNSEENVFGDDKKQYTFYHTPEGTVEIKLTKWSPDAVTLLTGNTTATVSGVGEVEFLGTQKDIAPKEVMVRVTIPTRDDATGAIRILYLIALRVTFKSLWDSGINAERGKATELTWMGSLSSSTKDETGDALPAGVDYAFVKRILATP